MTTNRSTTTGGRVRRVGRVAAVLTAAATIAASLIGALALSATAATAAPAAPRVAYPLGPGYTLIASDGGVFNLGLSQFYGSMGSQALNKPIVGGAEDPFLEGYWMVASDGGIFSFGSAQFYGSTGNITLNKPIVGMAPTSTGLGYWLVASDGGVFSFGDASFHGSTGNLTLNKPVVGMAGTPDGAGYWLVASDGGVFSFGDAGFHGSSGNITLNKPIVGMAATTDGQGYWLVASDGGIFNYGDAGFLGSLGNLPLNKPIVAMAARPPLAVKVDPYVASSSQTSSWVNTGTSWQLQLANISGGSVPAGARVLGVEGLDVSQLQTLGFTVAGGTCSGAAPYYLLTAYNPSSGATDVRTYDCSNGGSGATKTFDPVAGAVGAAPLPSNDVVQSLDIVEPVAGTSTNLTNIAVAGLTITDYRTFTVAGTIIG